MIITTIMATIFNIMQVLFVGGQIGAIALPWVIGGRLF